MVGLKILHYRFPFWLAWTEPAAAPGKGAMKLTAKEMKQKTNMSSLAAFETRQNPKPKKNSPGNH